MKSVYLSFALFLSMCTLNLKAQNSLRSTDKHEISEKIDKSTANSKENNHIANESALSSSFYNIPVAVHFISFTSTD